MFIERGVEGRAVREGLGPRCIDRACGEVVKCSVG